jgi:hypothetical protein
MEPVKPHIQRSIGHWLLSSCFYCPDCVINTGDMCMGYPECTVWHRDFPIFRHCYRLAVLLGQFMTFPGGSWLHFDSQSNLEVQETHNLVLATVCHRRQWGATRYCCLPASLWGSIPKRYVIRVHYTVHNAALCGHPVIYICIMTRDRSTAVVVEWKIFCVRQPRTEHQISGIKFPGP